MPRMSRKQIANDGEFFHILVEGLQNANIFSKNSYKEYYISSFISKLDEYNLSLIAYSVLNNHAHFIVSALSCEDLSKYFKVVNTIYARFFNKQEDKVGYVFRGRFKSETLEDAEKVEDCINFVHLNAENAKISKFNDYNYSSYKNYVSKSGKLDFAKITSLLGSIPLSVSKPKSLFIDDEFEHEESSEYIDSVLSSLIKKYKIVSFEDLKDNHKLGNLAGELKDKCKLSLVDLQTILEINRESIRLAINKYYNK